MLNDTERPSSILEHEKYEILNRWIERKIIPVVLVSINCIFQLYYYTVMHGL